MTRKSWPSGAAPYSAALISLSVPSTPTRSTLTRTPRPPGMSSTEGFTISARWTLSGFPGITAMAFMVALPPGGLLVFAPAAWTRVRMTEVRVEGHSAVRTPEDGRYHVVLVCRRDKFPSRLLVEAAGLHPDGATSRQVLEWLSFEPTRPCLRSPAGSVRPAPCRVVQAGNRVGATSTRQASPHDRPRPPVSASSDTC